MARLNMASDVQTAGSALQTQTGRANSLANRLLRQIRYEHALALCSQALLQSVVNRSQRADVLSQALRPLRDAAGISCAGVFENFENAQQQLHSRLVAESVAPGLRSKLDTPQTTDIPWTDGPIRAALEAHRPAHVARNTTLNGEPVVTDSEFATYLFLPIHVSEQWWGYIVFGDTDERRTWDDDEVRLLDTATEIIANFVRRIQAEAAQQDSEEQFRLAFERSANGLAIVGSEFRIQRVNARFCALTGYAEDELSQRPLVDILPFDELAPGAPRLSQLARGDVDQYSLERRYLRPDGSTCWLCVTPQLVLDTAGNPRYILVRLEDVSASKEALRYGQFQSALAACSRSLLASTVDPAEQQAALTSALFPLLEAAQADRAYIFRNFDDPELGRCLDMLAETCAPGIQPHISNPINHRFPWSEFSDHLRRSLMSKQPYGGPIQRALADMPHLVDTYLRIKGSLLSFQLFPIHFGEDWWGFVGFDDCRTAREWDEMEVMLLRTASEMIGSTLQRWQAEARERQARDELEQRIDERTRELRQRLDTETALAALSSRLLIEPDFDRAIQLALAEVGRTLDAADVVLLRATQDRVGNLRVLHHWRNARRTAELLTGAALDGSFDGWLRSPTLDGALSLLPQDAPQPERSSSSCRTSPIVLPLRAEQQLLGVLACANLHIGPETIEQQVATVQVIADLLTGLLQRAEMVETLEQRVADRTQELSTFFDLAMLVSSTRDLSAIIEPTLPKIMEIGRCQAIAVHLLSEDRTDLILAAQRGVPDTHRGNMQVIRPRAGLAAWLNQFEQPVLSSDGTWPAMMPAALSVPGYQRYLGAQLRAGGEVLGILSCYRAEGGFSLNHISVLAALAEQIGVVIENQRLRQRAEETAVVSERQRLARELHDAVTQSLYSQSLFARAARNALDEGDTARLRDSLGQLEFNAGLTLREMRLLLHELRPAALMTGGLRRALHDRLEWVERRVGIAASCHVDDRLMAGRDVEDMLYRVALEALNNALRHANATQVDVDVRCWGRHVRLTVSDDGCGFDPARVTAGMGLAGMQDRVCQQGGKLKVVSAPGCGTTVTVLVSAPTISTNEQGQRHESTQLADPDRR